MNYVQCDIATTILEWESTNYNQILRATAKVEDPTNKVSFLIIELDVWYSVHLYVLIEVIMHKLREFFLGFDLQSIHTFLLVYYDTGFVAYYTVCFSDFRVSA